MSGDELAFLPATALAGAIRSKQLSPVEATRFVLERIDRLNPRLNAYLTVCHDEAMASAREAEAALARPSGGRMGLLHGVPVSIKDLSCTRGIRTTHGSVLYIDHVPDHDAPAVERLRRAGAIIVGKTNTPEFGLVGTTQNLLGEPCRNPWDLERTSGGSSGGAGAAVATGLAPLAQGSDGGGSIRIPSGFCGVFGLKPTYGRVPRDAPCGGWSTLSVMGPMTRTVADAALMLDAMAGQDPRDPLSVAAPTRPYAEAIRGDIRGLRVAWSPDLGFAAVDREVRSLAEEAARRFQDFGCLLEEDHPGISDPTADRTFADIIAAYDAAQFEGLTEEQEGLMADYSRALIAYGRQVTGVQHVQATQRRWILWSQMRDFFQRYDLLLTPTLAVPAFPIGQEPKKIDGREIGPFGWSPFTAPFNLSGQPAASVPCGWTAQGLPVGLQIIGRPYEEATVLRAAAAFEAAHPWQGRIPPLD